MLNRSMLKAPPGSKTRVVRSARSLPGATASAATEASIRARPVSSRFPSKIFWRSVSYFRVGSSKAYSSKRLKLVRAGESASSTSALRLRAGAPWSQAELSTPERAFRAAQKALEEGEPSETPTFALQRAMVNRRRLERSIGAGQGKDQIFWALVGRPSDVGWRVILDQAGTYVQNQWEAMRPALLESSPGTKQSRVTEFVNNGPAAPFLERRRDSYSMRTLLDENLSFTRPFLDYLARLRLSPEDFGRVEPPRQIVAAP